MTTVVLAASAVTDIPMTRLGRGNAPRGIARTLPVSGASKRVLRARVLAAAAVLSGCGATHMRASDVQGRSAAWNGWRSLSAEQVAGEAQCFGRTAQSWDVVVDGSGNAIPSRRIKTAPTWPPKFVPSQALRAELARAERSRVLESDGGFLALADNGEFGAKLFALENADATATLVGSFRGPAWIGHLKFGVLLIEGSCHGDACAADSRAFRVERADGRWVLAPHSRWKGCSATVAVEPMNEAALVASCGSLYRITEKAVETVARWPDGMMPTVGDSGVVRDAKGATLVSFGERVARLQPGHPTEWYAPPDCARLTVSDTGACACAAAQP